MAELIWSFRSQCDLYNIIDYIAEDNPVAAVTVSDHIQASAERLRQFPRQGRMGRMTGTRELVTAQMPYILIYTEKDEKVVIVHILHQSQHWPQE